MNVLILTGKLGMGHLSAAKALEEEILLVNPTAKVYTVDFIELMFNKTSKLIYSGFDFLVNKLCYIYTMINHVTEKNSHTSMQNYVVNKLEKLIIGNDIDLIITTFPICSKYVSSYKRNKKSNIPLYTYITDVTVHEEWLSENTDMYFVASEETKEILKSYNVKDDKICVSGIPTRIKFKEKINSKKNKIKNVLVMGGGLGLIPNIENFIRELKKIDNVKVTIIVGKNKKLFKKLKKYSEEIEIIGFTNNVDKYMKKSDLVITKAGGITLFEAIYTSTPLLIIKPFLLQEKGNAKYIEKKNIGSIIWNKKANYKELLEEALKDERILEMKYNMENLKSTFESTSPFEKMYERENKLCI